MIVSGQSIFHSSDSAGEEKRERTPESGENISFSSINSDVSMRQSRVLLECCILQYYNHFGVKSVVVD